MYTTLFYTRLNGYRRKVQYECATWFNRFCSERDLRRRNKRDQRNFETWISRLELSPPDVFIGPDSSRGGVRGHVRNIRKYSSLKVQLVPDETAMEGLENFTSRIRERFLSFDVSGSSVVHSHVDPWMIQWCRRQQKLGALWIHTYHNMYFPEFAIGELAPWQHEINHALIHEARHADIRLSVARWQQDYLRSEYAIETDYLPNGVDVEACDQGRAERFVSKYKIGGPFILYVGRNQPVKNPADFARLAITLPTHTFVMLGQELSNRVLLEEWDVIVPKNLIILGAASHAEVQDALAACSLLVVTSKREGLPTLVLEAMAHRKPVIVPNEAGCMETIAFGEFGHIYEQGDIDDLANKTQLALKESRTGEGARQRVLEEYDWRVVIKNLDEVYRSGILS